MSVKIYPLAQGLSGQKKNKVLLVAVVVVVHQAYVAGRD